MKKLIVKSQLVNRLEFERQMVQTGQEMSPVIWQHERVYLPHDYRPEQNYPRLVLRTEVRRTDEPARYSMYLKRHIEDSGIDWVNFTPVGDYQEAAAMIHQLGFRKAAEVSRQRREIRLDRKTVIYLDEVEGLDGAYIKIEADLDDGQSVDLLRADLFKILLLLGQETFIMQAYFDLLSNDAEEFFVE